MRQLIQDLKSGETILTEVPAPQVSRGHILVRTTHSLVSLGTERMLVEFGRAGWLEKARQQPEKVKQVLDKIKSDGLQPTLEAVFRKLGEPLPLGYCNAGVVVAVGEGVTEFRIGDRVASNGRHAEYVCVPKHLAARIPDGVTDEEGSFAVIGAIALQGIRLVQPTFGETVVVTGLGLIGLIAAQLLRANGCRVIGLDFDSQKVALAKSLGLHAVQVDENTDSVQIVDTMTNSAGADAVLITASTKSNEVVSQAARMSRKRGRIVLVGVVGLDLQRSDFYEKELTFQVSCSYGPGRYDDAYEAQGHDYPIGFVRWTEQRNFEAVLAAIADRRLQVQPLITERVELADFQKIYGDMGRKGSIASVLCYPEGDAFRQDLQDGQDEASGVQHPVNPVNPVQNTPPHLSLLTLHSRSFEGSRAVLGIIGSGNFTGAVVLPMLSKLNADIKYIASANGLSGTQLARKHGIAHSTTDYRFILQDPEVDAVLITTRHNSHARLCMEALEAGKHVFVEKPLALNHLEINAIETILQRCAGTLTVGFNRRFSPFAQEAKQLLGTAAGPMHVVATMNAGRIPPSHWTQDLAVGGGRIIGEACHLIDLIAFLTDSPVQAVVTNALGPDPDLATDNASILLRMANGSTGAIHYFANGHKAHSKERVEIHSQGRTVVIDNFRRATYFGFRKSGLSMRQDKGHRAQFALFLERLRSGGAATIPAESLLNTSRAAVAAVESLRTGAWAEVTASRNTGFGTA